MRPYEEFNIALDLPHPTVPAVPSDEQVRFRLRFMAEEFIETLRAALYAPRDLDAIETALARVIDDGEIDVELDAFVDGLADQKAVIDGTYLYFGVDCRPIEAEVLRANMAKAGGPVRADGKRLKPPGWTPPEIRTELRLQGWEQGWEEP